MSANSSIKGGRELDAFLRSLPAKVEKNILGSALRAGANVLKTEVEHNLASNRSIDSGELLASVRVSVLMERGVVTAAVRAGSKKAFYPGWVEHGTRPHKITAKKGGALNINGVLVNSALHPGAKAKPYMRPALDAKTKAAIQAMAAQIQKCFNAEGINTTVQEIK